MPSKPRASASARTVTSPRRRTASARTAATTKGARRARSTKT